jgi:hypothetical protein
LTLVRTEERFLADFALALDILCASMHCWKRHGDCGQCGSPGGWFESA